MKLGIFDSGLGGLVIAKAIHEQMPDLDFLYYGDTLHLPYGNRSKQAIFEYTKNAMIKMFEQDCSLIIIACNTASAAALRMLQQQWLPNAYPDRNIIGVVVPTLETAIDLGHHNIGLIATNYIIESNVYAEELSKINNNINLTQKATPLLVPLIEHDGMQWADDVLKKYLKDFTQIECLILGCTHYPALRQNIRNILGKETAVLGQDEIIPVKLAQYLENHPEYQIDRTGKQEFYVSDLTQNYLTAARTIYGEDIKVNTL